MTRTRRALGLALALAFAATAGHGPVRAETLSDVLVDAWRNSPDLARQGAQVRIAAERAVQARAGGRPQVDGQVGLEVETQSDNNSFIDSENGPFLDDLGFPTTLQLAVSQPLYTGGQVANRTEAAETRITVEEILLAATEQQVLLDAVTAYSDVRRDIFLVDVAENNVRVLTEQLRAARERFAVGEVTRTDVEQARARLAAARSRLAAARGQLQVSRETFADEVGRPPGDLEDPPPLPDLPGTLEAAVQIAADNEPNLRAARREREASGFDVRAAIGQLLPRLALEARLTQFDDIGDGTNSQRTAAIGLNLTIPFYSGGANYSAVRQAQAQVEGSEAQITTALRDAIRLVGVSWSQLKVARASIEAGKQEVRAAELAFEGVTEEAKVGARTTLDVLDAEEEVLQARANLITAQRDEYVAAYRMLASVGKLTLDHLGLDPGRELAAPDYYETVRDRYFGYDSSDDTVWSLPYRP